MQDASIKAKLRRVFQCKFLSLLTRKHELYGYSTWVYIVFGLESRVRKRQVYFQKRLSSTLVVKQLYHHKSFQNYQEISLQTNKIRHSVKEPTCPQLFRESWQEHVKKLVCQRFYFSIRSLAHTFDVNVPQLLLWKTMFLDKRFFLVGRNFCM